MEQLHDTNRNKMLKFINVLVEYVDVLKIYIGSLKVKLSDNYYSKNNNEIPQIEDFNNMQNYFHQVRKKLINYRHIIQHVNNIYLVLFNNRAEVFQHINKSKDSVIKLATALYEYMDINGTISKTVDIMERIARVIIYHKELKEKFAKVRKIWKKHCLKMKKLYKKKEHDLFFQYQVNPYMLFPSEFNLSVIYADTLKKEKEKKQKALKYNRKKHGINENNNSNVDNLYNAQNDDTDIEFEKYTRLVNDENIEYMKRVSESNPNQLVYESAYFRYIYKSIMKRYETITSEKALARSFYKEYRSVDAIVDIITAHISNLKFFMKEQKKKLLKLIKRRKEIVKRNAHMVDKIEVIKKLIYNKTDDKQLKGKYFFEIFLLEYRFLINLEKEDVNYINNFLKFVKTKWLSTSKWKKFLRKQKNDCVFGEEHISYNNLMM